MDLKGNQTKGNAATIVIKVKIHMFATYHLTVNCHNARAYSVHQKVTTITKIN